MQCLITNTGGVAGEREGGRPIFIKRKRIFSCIARSVQRNAFERDAILELEKH